METVPPLSIDVDDEIEVCLNPAFRAIRSELKDEIGLPFCPTHELKVTMDDKKTFELQRDILHAVFLPLKRILAQATNTASRSLPEHLAADPERAFHGKARHAFVWLRSIITDEPDWCAAKGCPACVVLHIFHSEPQIRIVAVACLFSDWLLSTGTLSPRNQLPKFRFLLRALANAVFEDKFWGYSFWLRIYDRAAYMDYCTCALMGQCLQIRRASLTIPDMPLRCDAGVTSDGRYRIKLEDTSHPLYTPVRDLHRAEWEDLARKAQANRSCSGLQPRNDGRGYIRRKHGVIHG
ncbi:hypothetical protein FQN49_000157 [Arthroderma sp. PD_2]|nr:hypothetical protein FQN49_000157 [Arthroderma sp. PD_2]